MEMAGGDYIEHKLVHSSNENQAWNGLQSVGMATKQKHPEQINFTMTGSHLPAQHN